MIDRLGRKGSAVLTISEEGQGQIPDLELKKPDDVRKRIAEEAYKFRKECLSAPGLSELMEQ